MKSILRRYGIYNNAILHKLANNNKQQETKNMID